jgi:hypothetical protein
MSKVHQEFNITYLIYISVLYLIYRNALNNVHLNTIILHSHICKALPLFKFDFKEENDDTQNGIITGIY